MDDYRSGYNIEDAGYAEEALVDADTIERDDGWTIASGPLEGTNAEGRVYIYSLSITYSAPGDVSSSQDFEAHATVFDDGSTYFFYACGN